jgi:ribonuclease HII
MLIGIDEVGRGCWAGPLCVAAVSLTRPIGGLTDSKLLNHASRTVLAGEIRRSAHIAIYWVPAPVIDVIGLGPALRKAMTGAAAQLPGATTVIVDGSIDYLSDYAVHSQAIVKADLIEPAVSAASIIAKVARDSYMRRMSEIYPDYGFERHVGYGTAVHAAALAKLGPTALHRFSVRPVMAAAARKP